MQMGDRIANRSASSEGSRKKGNFELKITNYELWDQDLIPSSKHIGPIGPIGLIKFVCLLSTELGTFRGLVV